MTKKLFIKTYGCQMNVYDSMRMQDLMAPHGYKITESIEDADLTILNTCHIREKATEKMYSELGRIKKIKDHNRKAHNSEMMIAVAGCVGQAEGEEIFARAPYVNMVVGPQSYHSLPELVAKIHRKGDHLIELDFIEETKFDKLPKDLNVNGATASVSIQEGCDKFCSFCVVPYTRGAEFSRPLEQVYREVLQLVGKGVKEVTLLGQNVNAYHGKDANNDDCSLAGLIKYIAKIRGLERIRYITSHPSDMTQELIELHGAEEKLMPFLHLPVQAGSDRILKMMNRKYSRERYLNIIEDIRKARPDIAISSDFIVGFPGETILDFEDTLNLVKQVGFAQCFSFKYSPRPGTPAAVKAQVDESIKNERLKILQFELQSQQLEFNKKTVGKTLQVLFEREGKFLDQVVGKSPYLQSVQLINPDRSLIGKIVSVKIIEALPTSLKAEMIEKQSQVA